MDDKIQMLVADLTCDDILKCQNARRELVSQGSGSVGVLVEALSSKKPWVRWEAAKALGQIGSKGAIEALVAALQDPEFDVRWLAAEALIRIGPSALEPLLVALQKKGADSLEFRRAVHHVLHDMNHGVYGKLIKPVMAAVDDAAHAVESPLAARKALEELRAKRV